MQTNTLGLSLLLCAACIPPVGDSLGDSGGDDPNEGLDLPGPGPGSSSPGSPNGTEDPSGSDDTNSSNGGGDDNGLGSGDPDPSISLPAGTWTSRDALLTRDTCGWMQSGLDALGLAVEDFLPREFVVQPTLDGFQIEAQYFGAQGAIACVVQGFDFVCEQQTVTPEAYGLGSLGWSYAIEFQGRIPDLQTNDNIEGVARVRYTGVDGDTRSALSSVGLSAGDCAQDVYLMLGYRY